MDLASKPAGKMKVKAKKSVKVKRLRGAAAKRAQGAEVSCLDLLWVSVS